MKRFISGSNGKPQLTDQTIFLTLHSILQTYRTIIQICHSTWRRFLEIIRHSTIQTSSVTILHSTIQTSSVKTHLSIIQIYSEMVYHHLISRLIWKKLWKNSPLACRRCFKEVSTLAHAHKDHLDHLENEDSWVHRELEEKLDSKEMPGHRVPQGWRGTRRIYFRP